MTTKGPVDEMDTHGALRIDVSGKSPRDIMQPYVVRNIPAIVPGGDTEYANLVCWYNCPQGVVSVYVGDSFDWQGTPLVFPLQIDWRMFHGTGCDGQGGTFDQEPAHGSSIIKGSSGLRKEGLLFQFGGLQADQYLLQARIRVASASLTQLKATIYGNFQPGLQQAAPAITVGTMIG